MSPDPYAVLGVAHDVSDDELDRAFRDLVRRLHPDTRGQAGPDAEADRRLQELLTAYAHLRDPIRRAAYDRARAASAARARVPAADRRPATDLRPATDRRPATDLRPATDPRPRAATVAPFRSEPALRVGPVHWEPPPDPGETT